MSMSDPDRPARPWVVFSDDWGRHPSSCQHLIRPLLPHRPVLWVNTIGTRPPRFDWTTARRIAEKLKGWMRSKSRPDSDSGLSPAVLSPKMWPSFKSRPARWLNRRLLLRALRPAIAAMEEPPCIVTTLPLVADLAGEFPGARWAYYCVDDFSAWPGYDGATMQRMERELVPKIDVAIAVSETLQRHLAGLGRSSHLLTHGVDLEHWRSGSEESLPELAEFEGPLVVFWGVVDRRMDVAFVRALSNAMTAGTILLVGPQDNPEPELLKLPRVRWKPPWPFEKLPALARAAGVLVMPYGDMPATRAMQPLKLKEYLATGRPAVLRDLPATRDWADAADVVGTQDAFAEAVLRRLATGTPPEQLQARQRLDTEGWAAKAKQFECWVDGVERRAD